MKTWPVCTSAKKKYNELSGTVCAVIVPQNQEKNVCFLFVSTELKLLRLQAISLSTSAGGPSGNIKRMSQCRMWFSSTSDHHKNSFFLQSSNHCRANIVTSLSKIVRFQLQQVRGFRCTPYGKRGFTGSGGIVIKASSHPCQKNCPPQRRQPIFFLAFFSLLDISSRFPRKNADIFTLLGLEAFGFGNLHHLCQKWHMLEDPKETKSMHHGVSHVQLPGYAGPISTTRLA